MIVYDNAIIIRVMHLSTNTPTQGQLICTFPTLIKSIYMIETCTKTISQ